MRVIGVRFGFASGRAEKPRGGRRASGRTGVRESGARESAGQKRLR